MARGIAGEKFDIVKKWGINTYKVGFSPSPFPKTPPGYFSPKNPNMPSMAETRSLGVLEYVAIGREAGC